MISKLSNHVVLAGLFMLVQLICTSWSSLYSPVDRLWELDSTNFKRLVRDQNTAWIVEFYNEWCGHCIRFAPEWKSFAADVEHWKKVIRVGVVNCIDPENTNLCRQYEVAKYPTIKFFPPHINESDQGTLFIGDRDLWRLRSWMISFLESETPYPSSWPNFEEVKSYSIWDFFNKMPASVDTAFMFIERPDSVTGKEVILDLSEKSDILIRRLLTTNVALLHEIINEFKNATHAALVKVTRDGSKQLLNIFDRSMDTNVMRDLVYETLVGEARVQLRNGTDEDNDNKNHKVLKGVYMSDLENALSNMFRFEISVQRDISGRKLEALKAMLSTLRMYFPGRATVVNFLSKLNIFVDSHKGSLSGEDFAKALVDIETEDPEKTNLPKAVEWTGCQGSKPGLRSYNCGLWTLFHTLTVQAYTAFAQNRDSNVNPVDVLFAIRGYVTHFFSCDGCSRHFQEMSANLENEAKVPKDTVMWLWQAHNRVNKRLAGDETEDPKHPKIQFPSEQDCDKCRYQIDPSKTEWDENAVLRYLQYYYSSDRIKPVGTDLNLVQGGSIYDRVKKHSENFFSHLPNMLPSW